MKRSITCDSSARREPPAAYSSLAWRFAHCHRALTRGRRGRYCPPRAGAAACAVRHPFRFNDKNVGTDKAVGVTGLTLANGSGLASNYSVTQPTSLTASITPRALLVTATETNKRLGRTLAVRIYCCHF